MTIEVLEAGLLTTVQDLGRLGFQKDGVTVGGAMDRWALRLANILVDNSEGEAGLEMTLIGPTLRFEKDSLIAITGADLSPTISGKAVPLWRPVFIKSGSELRFQRCRHGCRSYLAVAGGFNVPEVMESKSTYLQAGFGGYDGRALEVKDRIETEKPNHLEHREDPFVPARWSISSRVLPSYNEKVVLRILPGSERDLFTDDAIDQLFTSHFKVSPQSNRMGYRCQGPSLKLKEHKDMVSSPVVVGTIQVPPDGQPIILMSDCQTTGGYPRIGHVIQADLPLLAQAKPGDTMTFQPITLDAAHRRLFEQEKQLRDLKRAIEMRCDHGTH